jgi:hypothetical protein
MSPLTPGGAQACHSPVPVANRCLITHGLYKAPGNKLSHRGMPTRLFVRRETSSALSCGAGWALSSPHLPFQGLKSKEFDKRPFRNVALASDSFILEDVHGC